MEGLSVFEIWEEVLSQKKEPTARCLFAAAPPPSTPIHTAIQAPQMTLLQRGRWLSPGLREHDAALQREEPSRPGKGDGGWSRQRPRPERRRRGLTWAGNTALDPAPGQELRGPTGPLRPFSVRGTCPCAPRGRGRLEEIATCGASVTCPEQGASYSFSREPQSPVRNIVPTL